MKINYYNNFNFYQYISPMIYWYNFQKLFLILTPRSQKHFAFKFHRLSLQF